MKHIFLISFLCLSLGNIAAAETRQEFSYGADPLQRLDVYQTQGATAAPLLVMLHGGAWRRGDKRSVGVWQSKAANWVPQGYVFISVNTRLLPQADPITQAADLAAALAFIQQNAARWGGDAEKMVVMGHSAGAHVAGLVATRNDIRAAAGLSPWAGTILLDTAALNIPLLMRDNPSVLYRDAFGADPAYWLAASPEEHLSAQEGPFLLVCSIWRSNACPAARRFADIASRQAIAVSVLPQALSHRRINTALGADNDYTSTVENWISLALQ